MSDNTKSQVNPAQKTAAIGILVAIVFGGGGFWGGTAYEKGQTPNLANMTPQQLRSQFQSSGNTSRTGMMGGFAGRGAGGGGATGQILSMDSKSVTIKLASGSTEVVYFDSTTTIDKTVAGASADLSVGQTIVVSGTSSNGSVTAKTIQIRPAQ